MIRKLSLALSAVMLAGAIGAGGAKADPLPGLPNLTFTNTVNSPKGYFSYVQPQGWTGGGNLIFVDSTSIPNAQADSSPYLTTYGNPSGSYAGNYVEADGNPIYENSFSTTVSGLTIGHTYTLTFYQGASQQTGFVGSTTNQWIVSLGTSTAGLTESYIGNGFYSYGDADPTASIVASPLMSVPSGGVVGWNQVSVNLTADAAQETLSFLAWGDNGNSANLPPMAFLAGIDQPAGLGSGTPEPAVWALMIIGLLGVGLAVRDRRVKKTAATVEA